MPCFTQHGSFNVVGMDCLNWCSRIAIRARFFARTEKIDVFRYPLVGGLD